MTMPAPRRTQPWHGVLDATTLPPRETRPGTEFVRALKLSMDLIGRYGGRCRQPCLPLAPRRDKAVRLAAEKTIAEGLA